MKRFLVFIVSVIVSVNIWAGEVPVVIVETNEATVKVAMSVIRSITYNSDTEMVINYNNGTAASSYLLDNIKSVKFGKGETTGIANVTVTADSGEVKMYDISGRQLSDMPLKRGVYVVMKDGKVKKMVGGK